MKNLEVKAVIISILILVVLFVLIPFSLLLSVDSISFIDQPSFRGDYKVYGDTNLKQEVYTDHNKFHAIAMSVKNPNLLNKNDLIIDIFDKSNNKVRHVKKTGLNIHGGSLVKFNFDPIEDSKDKKYNLLVYSPESQDFESFSIFLTSDQVSWIGDLKINDNLTSEKIALRVYYKPENRLLLIKNIYLSFFNNIFRDKTFMIFYFFIVLLLVSYIFIKNKRV